MKTPRFMTEYANCIKRTVQEYASLDSTTKQLAVDRIDKAVKNYTRSYITLVEAMDTIGSVLKAVQYYAYGEGE